jgi:succinoglycan biosynthesis protein ExoO
VTSVSVVVACYNATEFVDRAIESVKRQTLQDWEIVAVDDCSSDGTYEYLQKLAKEEPRIRVFSTERNGGPSAARNVAIEQSRGDWIAVLDSDDAFREDRLELMTRAASEVGAEMIFDNLVYRDANAGVETGIALRDLDSSTLKPITLAELINGERPGTKLKLGFLKPVVRREFLNQHQLRYDTRVRLAEDFDLYARILLAGGTAWLYGAPMYVYTTQVGHVSGVRSSATRTLYEPEVRVQLFERLIADHRAYITEQDLRLLERGRKWQQFYADAHDLGRYRREGNWSAFGVLAVRHPRALLRFVIRSKYLKRIFVRHATASGR